MMTKRSNHIPMFTKIDSTNMNGMLVRSFFDQKNCGEITLQVIIDQYAHAVRTERAVDEGESLVRIAAVPGDEELGRVRVADDRAGRQDDLVHVLEVLDRDQVLEIQSPARDQHQRHHHGEAGEDGARDEVGREDRRVPAGHDRGREVERHDRVHRKHQRRRNAGQNQVGLFVVAPVPGRPAPAEAEECRKPSDEVHCARSRRVARSGTRPMNQNSTETVA